MAIGKTYVLAVKREQAHSASPDWQDVLASIPGVSVTSPPGKRVQVVATDEAVAAIQERFGEQLHIEELAERRPLE